MKRAYFAVDMRVGETIPWEGSTAWNEGIHPGTEQMMYFEDNQFVWDDNVTDPARQCAVYGDFGGKCVFRYNTTIGMSYQMDAHGDGEGSSTVYYEIYNNTFNESFAYSEQGILMWQRGGQWIVHDNTFNTLGHGVHRMSVYRESDSVPHRVKNTYTWGNTVNGTPNTTISFCEDSGQTSPGYSCANIHQDAQWFAHAPTTGQTYFPYTPYTYPHPLVSGGGGSSPTPTPGGPTPTPGPTTTPTPAPAPLGTSFRSRGRGHY